MSATVNKNILLSFRRLHSKSDQQFYENVKPEEYLSLKLFR